MLKYFNYLNFIIPALLIAGDLTAQNDIRIENKFKSEFIFPFQEKHVHSSSVAALPNGDLICCWFQGSGERKANDVMIMGSRLKKGQTQWSVPFIMADTPNNPDCNPVIFLDHKNRLHLVWVVVVANQWEQSVLKTRISSDFLGDGAPKWEWQDIILLKPGEEFAKSVEEIFKNQKTPELAWGGYAPKYEKMIIDAAQDPVKRETGWMGRIKPLLLTENKIIMPLYSDGFNFSITAISNDNGETWKPGLPIVGRGNIQPVFLNKKDGTIVAYMRDNGDSPGRILKSISKDKGYSWTYAEKTVIPNSGASIDALELKDGNWILVCNDLEEGRHRLTIYLSDDEGISWKWKKSLENNSGGGFGYPAVIQGKDEKIHVTYSYHLEKNKTIKHCSFPASWIKEQEKVMTNAEKLGFQKGKKILLLHCDDAGMCEEANIAVKNYIEKGVVKSAAVMMPCAYAEEMVKWGIKNPASDLGVHLTLTSEWKNWRWGTVTNPAKVPGLLDKEGKMWKDVPEVVANATTEEVELEIRAQIAKMISFGYKPTHIDTHMGTLYGSPEFVKVFLNVAQELKIPANAIDLSNKDVLEFYKKAGYPLTDEVINLVENYKLPKLDNFTSVPDGKTYENKKENFKNVVKSLKPGLTEIIFHPSVETENLKTITGSWQQRVWEAKMFSDPEILNFFHENDIQLTTWREIMEKFHSSIN